MSPGVHLVDSTNQAADQAGGEGERSRKHFPCKERGSRAEASQPSPRFSDDEALPRRSQRDRDGFHQPAQLEALRHKLHVARSGQILLRHIAGVAGENDDRRLVADLAEMPDGIQPCHVRHGLVRDDEIEGRTVALQMIEQAEAR